MPFAFEVTAVLIYKKPQWHCLWNSESIGRKLKIIHFETIVFCLLRNSDFHCIFTFVIFSMPAISLSLYRRAWVGQRRVKGALHLPDQGVPKTWGASKPRAQISFALNMHHQPMQETTSLVHSCMQRHHKCSPAPGKVSSRLDRGGYRPRNAF